MDSCKSDHPHDPMKAHNFPSNTSLILKVIGITLILLYVLDLLLLLFTAQFDSNQWMLAFVTQMVDRGFLPLVGFAILATGFWADDVTNGSGNGGQALKLVAFGLASFLGLLFLLAIPLHVNATRTAVETETKRFSDELARAETQLNAQAQQQLDLQIGALDQAVKTGRFQNNQLSESELAQVKKEQERLQKLKADPKALEAQVAPQREQKLNELRSSKDKAEKQVQDNALRTGLRVGLASLLLAVSHALIGWTGLRRTL